MNNDLHEMLKIASIEFINKDKAIEAVKRLFNYQPKDQTNLESIRVAVAVANSVAPPPQEKWSPVDFKNGYYIIHLFNVTQLPSGFWAWVPNSEEDIKNVNYAKTYNNGFNKTFYIHTQQTIFKDVKQQASDFESYKNIILDSLNYEITHKFIKQIKDGHTYKVKKIIKEKEIKGDVEEMDTIEISMTLLVSEQTHLH